MKTYKHLYPEICRMTNLYRAYRAAAKGKRGKLPVAALVLPNITANWRD